MKEYIKVAIVMLLLCPSLTAMEDRSDLSLVRSTVISSNMYYCSLCSIEFYKKDSYQHHCRIAHKGYVCIACSKEVFKRCCDYNQHVQLVHGVAQEKALDIKTIQDFSYNQENRIQEAETIRLHDSQDASNVYDVFPEGALHF